MRLANQLGKSLLKENIITPNQLQHALQLQQESLDKKLLGEILLDLGYVTKRQLREVSRKYHFRIQIGALLVENGYITEEQLRQALSKQQTVHRPLGEILMEDGILDEEQLAKAISQQLDYPYFVPDKRTVDTKLLALFPSAFLRQHIVLPLYKNNDIVTVLVHNPLDPQMLQTLNSILKERFELAVGPKSVIKNVLREIMMERSMVQNVAQMAQQSTETTGSFSRYDLTQRGDASGGTTQISNMVDYIIANAINEGASDIHIESLYNKQRVRYRIDGKLVFKTDLPGNLQDSIIRRIKILAQIDLADSSDTLIGQMYVKVDEKEHDLRVSIYPTVLGTSITIRLLTKDLGLKDLEDLGMLPRVLSTLKGLLHAPSGFVLFSGPTGTGKTTSLYACLNYLNRDDMKICTLESPVEYNIEGIAQRQYKHANSKQMEEILKGIMHQDPDIIVIGEIHDEVTATASVQAALSGHKLFSTIHTDDSFAAIHRLMSVGLRTYLLSSTGIAVLAQRLVREVCSACKEKYTPPRSLFQQLNLVDTDPDDWDFYRGKGCVTCGQSGFKGRSGVYELLAVYDEVRNAFLEESNAGLIRKVCQNSRNYISLRQAGLIRALHGSTTLDEIFSILSYSERQAFASMSMTLDDINYWMEKEAERL